VGAEFFPTKDGVGGREGGGGHDGEIGFGKVRVDAVEAGRAGRDFGVVGMEEVGVGVLFNIREVKFVKKGFPMGAVGEGVSAGGIGGVGDKVKVAGED
jgi:hypothetical protein